MSVGENNISMRQSVSDFIFLWSNYNKFLRSYSREYAVILLGIFSQMVFYIVYPLIFKYIFDHIVPNKDIDQLSAIVVGLVTLFIVCGYGAYIQTKYMARVGGRVLSDLRSQMVAKFHSLPFGFYAGVDPVDLLSRFSSDMDKLENSLTRAMPSLLESILITAGCLVTICFIDWRLAVSAAILIPIGFAANSFLGPREDRLNSESRQQKNSMLMVVSDFINSWLLIRAFNDNVHVKQRFELSNHTYTKSSSKYSYCTNITPVFSDYGVNASLAVIVIVGAIITIQGALTAGAFIGCFALLRKVADGSAKSAKNYTTFINALRPYKRIQKLLSEQEIAGDRHDSIDLYPLENEIVFKNVSFEYSPGQLVLNDVSFSIKNGSSVAIVGTSGSGKSTLLKLIMRIIEPNMGSISYDGVNLDLASVASIRRHSSMVLQESHVLRGTIAENIRYGSSSIGDEQLYEAAKMAGIHDFITQLPLGYHTVINDRGSSLSGGQRQRIAIARAFAHDLPLLFLDEPTSMLDPINEAAINETFIELADGRTVILVSHRLAISRDFDKILVLDKGKLIEEGNHHELMAMGGFYRTMWDKQNGFMISSEGSAKISPERLRLIPIFSNLELEVLADLAAQFDSEAFESGVRIIQEGAQGDKFYIAVRGNLKVLKKDSEGRDVELAVLSDGDHFGEIALMKSVARTASIEALSHTSCLSLSRERFKRLVETQPEVFKVLTDAMSARISA